MIIAFVGFFFFLHVWQFSVDVFYPLDKTYHSFVAGMFNNCKFYLCTLFTSKIDHDDLLIVECLKKWYLSFSSDSLAIVKQCHPIGQYK